MRILNKHPRRDFPMARPMVVVVLFILLSGCTPPNQSTKAPSPESAHDGSALQGQVLSLGVPYSGRVGSSSDPVENTSYYDFIAPTTTAYVLTFSQTSPLHDGGYPVENSQSYFDIYLRSSSNLSGTLEHFYGSQVVSPVWDLEAGKSYRIQVTNAGKAVAVGSTTYTIQVVKRTSLAFSETVNLGAVGTEGVRHPMVVTSGGFSTYTFHSAIGAWGNYRITYPAGILGATLRGPDPDDPNVMIVRYQETNSSQSSFQGTGLGMTDFQLTLDMDSASVGARIAGTLEIVTW